MPVVGVFAFLLIKFLAYAAWCWFGLSVLAPPRSERLFTRAAILALVRMALGFGLGWLMVFVLTFVAPEQNRLGLSLPALLLGFVFLRWLEWSFVGALMTGHARQPRVVLAGTHFREHLWRIGGLAVSFVTDLTGALGVGALGAIPC